MWSLHSSGGVSEGFADRLLSDSALRRWAIRFLSESGDVSEPVALKLISLAHTDSNVDVRGELASAAQRLPASVGLRIAERLAQRDGDVGDPHIPLLVWWAVEKHCVGKSQDLTLELFGSESAWSFKMNREVILERLIRRYAAEGSRETLRACATLLEAAREPGHRRKLLVALELGLAERSGDLSGSPRPDTDSGKLGSLIDEWGSQKKDDATLLRIGSRLGRPLALRLALETACDPGAPEALRVSLMTLFGELARPGQKERLIGLLDQKLPRSVLAALVETLGSHDDRDVAVKLIRRYPAMDAKSRAKARGVLFSRRAWAGALVDEYAIGRLSKDEVQLPELRRIHLHKDSALNEKVRKLWGSVTGGTAEETLAVIRRFRNDLNAGPGDATRGRAIFQTACAICHRLYEEGNELGPDLTHANRKDREYLLTSIVDPSAVIRTEHLSFNL